MNSEDECNAAWSDEEETIIVDERDYTFLLLEFKGHRRGWFANPKLVSVQIGEIAVTEADRGEEAGIVRSYRQSLNCTSNLTPYIVKRVATEADLAQIERHREIELTARTNCASKIKFRKLQMKLVDAELRLDGQKLIFYFTAEGRVDFRYLVRDLAASFRTRIELRQIGSRDELKRGDCFGVCGMKLCCGNFLNCFIPITTGMAKSQHLILNPIKLSGRCSRLKCCLAFEMPNYIDSDSAPNRINLPTMNDSDSRMEIMSD